MKKQLTPKSCGHKTVPLDHFQRYKIILESVDTILYPHTNLYPTLNRAKHAAHPVPEWLDVSPAFHGRYVWRAWFVSQVARD